MPLELIGVGFGRTGTDSTRSALDRLGLPCYHMKEVLENRANRDHLAFWNEVADAPPGTQHDWERVFGRYRAAVDNPAAVVWRELMAAYPEAKILLTTHPGGARAWYRSTRETIYAPEERWEWRLLRLLVPRVRRLGAMTRRLVWQRSLRGTMPDEERAVARYRQHIEEVRAEVPRERLLEFSVDQGWEPLCRCLGVPVPDEPFPRVNDRAAMQRNIRRFHYVAWAIAAVAAVATLGLLALLVRAF